MRLPIAVLLAATLSFSAGAQETANGGLPDVGASQAELDAVTRDIELTRERQDELRREIESLDKDRSSLNQALIEGSQEVQRLETELGEKEARLAALMADEDSLRTSLAERRSVLSEVLAALQRMGHRPPPVILVRPNDALASIRSAILLGAVVPDLRSAADVILADLEKLVAVRKEQEAERDRLKENATALAEGRTKIALLIEERQRQRTASAEALAAEERRAQTLAEQAESLRELIARIEKESAMAAAAAAAAEQAAADNRAEGATPPATGLGPNDRLQPAVAFASAKGRLPIPAAGTITKAFGIADGLGGVTQGISLATRPDAQVSSPADGWVVYSGPFRSYGKLLILSVGDGYHVLLAGMERIDVQLGQFVLAGEPVAVMAAQRLASVGAVNVGATEPVLYIEFQKDGASIDPAPWWAASQEKVGG